MKRQDGFMKRAGDFLAGRGFYIVLILCVAVIGVSAWAMLVNNNVDRGPALPVIAEVDDWAQLPPRLPALSTPPPRPVETPPPDEEAFLGREEDEAPPEPPPPPPPPAEPTVEEPRELRFICPVFGIVEVPHAVDHLIFDRTMGDWRTHNGVDITAELGEPVLAIAEGTIERVFHDDLLGATVVIYHGQGLHSLYANLMETPIVEVGQWVTMGTPIGAVGTTALGKSGIVHHVHLEILEHGVQADPLMFLPAR
ncbi:MAG: M23 family metallopeptidase [Oscillospiraceae bacterium]|nr:M23 family metallopeptidase [Oscillospiraceae bacterium]